MKYGPDEVVFSQGAPCSEVNYIEEGPVKLTTVSKRGRAAILAFLWQDDFLANRVWPAEPAVNSAPKRSRALR